MSNGLKRLTAGFLLAAFTLAGTPAFAQTGPAQTPPAPPPAVSTTDDATRADALAVKYANALHLAYIKTSGYVNSEAESGLKALVTKLNERTSVEPEGVVGLDIEKDNLTFFPFIYWPVTSDAKELSEAAQQKVQDYINGGGVIVFDVRDQSADLNRSEALRRILSGINIKPLVKMGEEHTLTHAFYMVSGLPGSSNRSPIWVEAPGSNDAESVSSVIIGQSNWAGAWAGRTLMAGSEEQDMALRAGVNMVMFALSGNYKADQVHAASMAAKLGKPKTEEPKQP